LNVGDTVWVMIDPLKNQNYDSFTGFDFSIMKSVVATSGSMALMAASAVPEPTSAVLAIGALALYGLRRPRRRFAPRSGATQE
jgi:MYXO-CTERM domain-containing protein